LQVFHGLDDLLLLLTLTLLLFKFFVTLSVCLPFFGAKWLQLDIDLSFALLHLLSEDILRKILCFQRELVLPQFLIQLLAPRLVGRAQSFPSAAGRIPAFACALCPLLEAC